MHGVRWQATVAREALDTLGQPCPVCGGELVALKVGAAGTFFG
jgi:hypothetical protein